MTEAEWNRSADPLRMVAALPPTVSRGELLLFAVGCCRLFESELKRPSAPRLLEAAEQFADGSLDAGELGLAIEAAVADHSTGNNQAKGRNHPDRAGLATAGLIRAVVGRMPERRAAEFSARAMQSLRTALTEVLNHAAHRRNPRTSIFSYDDVKSQTLDRAAALLRDVIGPPAGVPELDLAWLTSDVVALCAASTRSARSSACRSSRTRSKTRVAITTTC